MRSWVDVGAWFMDLHTSHVLVTIVEILLVPLHVSKRHTLSNDMMILLIDAFKTTIEWGSRSTPCCMCWNISNYTLPSAIGITMLQPMGMFVCSQARTWLMSSTWNLGTLHSPFCYIFSIFFMHFTTIEGFCLHTIFYACFPLESN